MSDVTVGLIVGFLGIIAMVAGTLWSRHQRLKSKSSDPEELNVGITSATLILQIDANSPTLTVPGQRFISEGQQYAITSDVLFDDAILQQWIPVDDGRLVNRNQVAWIIDRKKKEFYL